MCDILDSKMYRGDSGKLDQFKGMGRLGEGTYGVVYKAQNKITGKYVAIKKIKLEKYSDSDSDGIPSTALREVCLLRGLDHSCIVALYDVVCVPESLYMIFEFLDIDLKKYIDRMQNDMAEDLLRSYVRQLLEGISYLHMHRILHRDLKPQNLLLDREGHIKLADFGLSRSVSLPLRTYTHEVVTLWYRAPELLLGAKVYCIGIDTWSIGCIIVEMINQCPLFAGDSEIDQLYKIFKLLGTPSEAAWPGITRMSEYRAHFPVWDLCPISEHVTNATTEMKKILDSFFKYDPLARETADITLKNPYIKNARLTCPDLDCFDKLHSD